MNFLYSLVGDHDFRELVKSVVDFPYVVFFLFQIFNPINPMPSPYKLDETDIKILRVLQQNARLTNKEVADKVNLTTTPVYERIKRLEREGYIKAFVAVLDPEKVDKGFVVFCSVKMRYINYQIATEFAEFVKSIPEVTECYNISGAFDFMLKVHCPNMKYYQQFVLEVLGQRDYLAHIESTFVMEALKHEYGVRI